jgi:signal-transduction protein with cAMP-binding, CBS, and nucleotidyltransferase domain
MQSEIDYLKNLSFFEGFSKAELELLLELNRIDRYNEGELIIKEDEDDEISAGFYFVILRGSVNIKKQNKKLATLEKGD